MALLERVAALLRANLYDMIERAEDPHILMKQVILDMENQMLQVKTQVAIAVADQHLLEKKRDENRAREADWVRKAEMALQKQDEELARAALQRSLACRDMSKSFDEQIADQQTQVGNLKAALAKLDAKLAEARAQAQLLLAQHRRARAINLAADGAGAPRTRQSPNYQRPGERVDREMAIGLARTEMLSGNSVEERFAQLEKQDEVERLLQDLKARKSA